MVLAWANFWETIFMKDIVRRWLKCREIYYYYYLEYFNVFFRPRELTWNFEQLKSTFPWTRHPLRFPSSGCSSSPSRVTGAPAGKPGSSGQSIRFPSRFRFPFPVHPTCHHRQSRCYGGESHQKTLTPQTWAQDKEIQGTTVQSMMNASLREYETT